jgi:hypothetical protein
MAEQVLNMKKKNKHLGENYYFYPKTYFPQMEYSDFDSEKQSH